MSEKNQFESFEEIGAMAAIVVKVPILFFGFLIFNKNNHQERK